MIPFQCRVYINSTIQYTNVLLYLFELALASLQILLGLCKHGDDVRRCWCALNSPRLKRCNYNSIRHLKTITVFEYSTK